MMNAVSTESIASIMIQPQISIFTCQFETKINYLVFKYLIGPNLIFMSK
jgi:hypothetical protein